MRVPICCDIAFSVTPCLSENPSKSHDLPGGIFSLCVAFLRFSVSKNCSFYPLHFTLYISLHCKKTQRNAEHRSKTQNSAFSVNKRIRPREPLSWEVVYRSGNFLSPCDVWMGYGTEDASHLGLVVRLLGMKSAYLGSAGGNPRLPQLTAVVVGERVVEACSHCGPDGLCPLALTSAMCGCGVPMA